jgi:hypothetical protein
LHFGFKIKDILVEREIIRPIPQWRERYLDSVWNMEICKLQGRYHYNGVLMPSDIFGTLATLSPRSINYALLDLMKENLDLTFGNHTQQALEELSKQTSRWFGFLHQHKTKGTRFVTVDQDDDNKDTLKGILDLVSSLPIWMVTETGRGYHVILDVSRAEDAEHFFAPAKGGKPSLSKQIADGFVNVEIQNDSQEPISGTRYASPKDPEHFVTIIQ